MRTVEIQVGRQDGAVDKVDGSKKYGGKENNECYFTHKNTPSIYFYAFCIRFFGWCLV
jgi:hypothetical protein